MLKIGRYLLIALFAPALFAQNATPAFVVQNNPPVESLYPDDAAGSTQQKLINQRLSKIENLLQSKGLISLLQQLETLQQEVAELRGQIEVNTHKIETMQKRQRALYIDIDNRIQSVEQKYTSHQSGTQRSGTQNSQDDQRVNTVAEQSTEESPEDNPVPAASSEQTIAANNTETLAVQESDQSQIQQAEYQRAFELLKNSKYSQAIKALGTFLQDHPQSKYSDNAQYWLAEAYYAQNNYGKSIETYKTLIKDYPESQKLPQSLLKIGYSYEELNQLEQAKLWYIDVKQRFPDSTASRLAADRLKRI